MSAVALGETFSLRRSLRDVRSMPVTVLLALLFVVLVLLLSLFGAFVFGGSPSAQHLFNTSAPPSSHYWLGTDQFGRDVFARIIAGTRTALLGPFVVAFSGLVVSAYLGIVAGYMGGRVDASIMRIVDFFFALPSLLVAIVVVAVIGGGYVTAIIVLCVLNVQGDIRIVRSAAVEQRPLPYIEAARTLGVPRRHLMFRHILPNISPILVADFAIDFSGALIALAGLAFLGLGSSVGSAEWGRMLAEGQPLLFTNAAAALAPGVAIILLAVSVNMIGDWVYEHYSSRGRSER